MESPTVDFCVSLVREALLDSLPFIRGVTAGDFDNDLDRVSLNARSRGLALFGLVYPALLKHFDKCLNAGSWQPTQLVLGGSKGESDVRPRHWWGLYSLIFTSGGTLRRSPSIQAISLLRQIYSIGGKIKVVCHEAKVKDAVRDFVTVEEGLPAPDLDWGSADLSEGKFGGSLLDFSPEISSASPVALRVCQQVADRILVRFGDFVPELITPRHGPGAVSDLRPDRTSKYELPTWSERLDVVFPRDWFAKTSLSDDREFVAHSWNDVPAELLAVPKTMKTPRLIAKEPTSNQFIQQGLLAWLAAGISKTDLRKVIHLRDQSFNQRLALSASRTNSHATVDLSSASDRLTCRLIERIFRSRKDLLVAFNSCRTHRIIQVLDDASPMCMDLKKFSTMGSAVTFPVQSIVFAILAIGSVISSRGWRVNQDSIDRASREVLVFGDDSIIPDDSFECYTTVLTTLSLKVNADKTFRTGKFRESCGVEAFDGYDVTPIRLRTTVEPAKPLSVVSLVDTANNLFLKGYWRCSSLIDKLVAHWGIPNKRHDSGAFGRICFSDMSSLLLAKARWDRDLHKWYIRATTSVASEKTSRTAEPNGWPRLLQYFLEDPSVKYGNPYEPRLRGSSRVLLRTRRVYLEDLFNLQV